MAHSDDNGLVLPPRLAPIQVVIVPIFKGEDQLEAIDSKIDPIISELRKSGVSVKYDKRTTHKPGWKFAEYELKGVPVRLAIGARDLENGTIEIARRDTKEKQTVDLEKITELIPELLEEMQKSIFAKSSGFTESETRKTDSYEEFKKLIEKGGFVYAHWDGTAETEEKIKSETKATIRCIPLNNPKESGQCIYSGKPSAERVLFAKAY